MKKDIFGLIHLLSAFLMTIYGIVSKKSSLDLVFIYILIVVHLSWTFYNGECLLTLIHSNLTGSKSATARATDLLAWFENEKQYDMFMLISCILLSISTIRVFYRNYIPILLICIYLFTDFTYVFLIRYYNDCKNVTFLTIQGIYKIFYIYLLFYVYYNV